MSKKYTIKPLDWKGELKEEFDSIDARTVFGSYSIRKLFEGEFSDGGNPILLSYFYQEYRDEGYFPCASVEAAKELAEKHWQDRLVTALEPARVQYLDWCHRPSVFFGKTKVPERFQAMSVFGTYSVGADDAGGYYWNLQSPMHFKFVDGLSLEEAKAGAQSHFEELINSTFTTNTTIQ